MYLDGIEFAKNEIGRSSVRVMADVAYLLRGNQPLEDIAKEPEYCLHVHLPVTAGNRASATGLICTRACFGSCATSATSAAYPWLAPG